MAEMIERAARALSEAGGASDWDHALECARAVLQAIREPCEAVVAAGDNAAGNMLETDQITDYEQERYEVFQYFRDGGLPIWQAMIDKALEEGR